MGEGDYMNRFILIITAAFIIFSIPTYILYRLTIKNRYIKYLLPAVTLILTVYNFYLSRIPSEGFEGLGRLLMGIILFFCFLSSLLTSLFFDFIYPKLKIR